MMNQSHDVDRFFAEMEQRLDQLMVSFREMSRAAGNGADVQAFFKQLFGLQSWFNQMRESVRVSPAVLDDRERQFEWLYKSGLVLQSSADSKELLRLALDTLMEMSRCGRGYLATVTADGELDIIVARNFNRVDIPEAERHISKSVIDRVMHLRNEVHLRETDSLLQQSSLLRREGEALLCVPVLIDKTIEAVIYLDQFAGGIDVSVFTMVRHFSRQLGVFLKNAQDLDQLREERLLLLDQLRSEFRFEEIICKSKPMVRILKTVAKVAVTDAPVLIQGETGTGKELIARAVHQNSSRANGPFIEVDCGALPESLVESELFGHQRGSFTGAQSDKQGLMEAAHGGTLFLDEINNLPKDAQTKLLRVLQNKKVRRIGETRQRDVDFRLVAASGKPLKELVEEDRFRGDLFYRINTVAVSLPPLRERKEDLLLLAGRFLEKFSAQYGRGELSLDPDVIVALEAHHWPGNVRELEHVIERGVILGEGSRFSRSDLPAELGGSDAWQEEPVSLSLEDYVNRAKKYYISKVLAEQGGKKVEAARFLQINRSYLFQLIKQLGIS